MNKTVHITGATPASGAEEFADLGEMFRSLWRQKRLIAAVTFLCVALGATYAYQIATPKYRATSVLLLDTSGDNWWIWGSLCPASDPARKRSTPRWKC
ncbi:MULTISPECIES: Wzz/FepE/Etk N-terminal domain-containing protein [unclassified Aliiroseovarius]|uniref:Wzz/FepE/Etk N-terminal domain-containing protein n=1 Tax=unclassified Aliiroseovarius TaxID=2623558 RepID=UPI0015682823|nr:MULTISPECIES: Wzz/FepE/Etk N-terminal domain-containing protein [unclassified Aliiroseovarius]NRP30454.1 hypothetical protein [Aliiroseovarius sp. xm-m-314]NRP80096.1 hypothetical protein [Aliiroseovarius sp. xm-v-209]NRQ11217.1 hypothetical protein [Aliiroseovarius sp. xm-v-208]